MSKSNLANTYPNNKPVTLQMNKIGSEKSKRLPCKASQPVDGSKEQDNAEWAGKSYSLCHCPPLGITHPCFYLGLLIGAFLISYFFYYVGMRIYQNVNAGHP